MKKIFKTLFLFLLFFEIQYVVAQTKEDMFVFFVKQIIYNIEDYKSVLLMKYKGDNCIFVRSEPDYMNVDKMINDTLDIDEILYIWPPDAMFFHKIQYWMQFKKIEMGENKALFEIKTCSWSEIKKKKYLNGKIVFEKDSNGTWKVTNNKIKSVRYCCENGEIEQYNY